MFSYVLRRLLLAVPILLGILTFTFVLFHVVGGDPARQKAGKQATPKKLAEIRHELGTDRPILEQYGDFVLGAVTFDFGRSWSTERKVTEMLGDGVVPTLSLAIPAFFLETILAVSLALLCAYFRGTLLDRAVVVMAVAGMSVPSLAYILFGQKYLAYEWKLFPIYGFAPLPAGVVFLALPILIWVSLAVGGEVRFYRAVMLEEMGQDHIRTAAAKGVHPTGILFRHVLKNSMIQVITRVVMSIPFLLLGSLLLELFFGIPGLGALTVQAIGQSDFPVVQVFVVIGSVVYILFSILTDVGYALVDPRVRLR